MLERLAIGRKDKIAALAFADFSADAIGGIALLAIHAEAGGLKTRFENRMQRDFIQRIDAIDSLLEFKLRKMSAKACFNGVGDVTNPNHNRHIYRQFARGFGGSKPPEMKYNAALENLIG